jgi:hypothetical protein
MSAQQGPDPVRTEGAATAQAVLLDHIRALTDDEARRPSLLPGWSIGSNTPLIAPAAYHHTVAVVVLLFVVNLIMQATLDVCYGTGDPMYGDTFTSGELGRANGIRMVLTAAVTVVIGLADVTFGNWMRVPVTTTSLSSSSSSSSAASAAVAREEKTTSEAAATQAASARANGADAAYLDTVMTPRTALIVLLMPQQASPLATPDVRQQRSIGQRFFGKQVIEMAEYGPF